MAQAQEQLHQALQFIPDLVGDPAPPWIRDLLIKELDKVSLLTLGKIQLELSINVLKARQESLKSTLEVVNSAMSKLGQNVGRK